jgi:hypothetical protein
MKNQIKSISLFSLLTVLLFAFTASNSYSQNKGYGSTKIKAGTGTVHGINWVDNDGDGICDNFVDANGDGINDNPKGLRQGKSSTLKSASGTGRFGSGTGVCDGTRKGSRSQSGNSSANK